MSWLEPRLVKNARQKKKKRPSHSAYSTLCKCLFKCFFWSSGMPHLEGEIKRKKKQWNQTTQLLQQTPPPRGTRHHRFSKHARTAVSHEPKLERQPELRPGPLHDTHASGRKMPQPVARLSQEQSAHHHLDQNYLRRHFFVFSLAQAANQQHAGTTPNSMPLLRLQTASTRSPKSPGSPTPFPTPKPLARPSRSLASNNQASLLKQYL